MPTTNGARATTAASTDGDALQFECVTFSHLVRHQLNRIMRLSYMHTAPPKTLNPEQTLNTVTGGADLSLVRHFRRRLVHNLLAMNRLPLCLKKVEISGLVRHPCAGTPQLPLPQPTTYIPNCFRHHRSLANIRDIEYANDMQDTLRAYKASVFHALAHPTRIAIIEVLRSGELSTRAIQERLGIEQANLSQHLAILRSRQLVLNRKDGNQVFYSLRDPVLTEVLDIMRRHFQANLTEAVQMLGEIDMEGAAR